MDHLDQAILLRQVALLLVRITLPLSGRQGAWGGAAESLRRPVHSRGLLEGTGSACCMFLVLHRIESSDCNYFFSGYWLSSSTHLPLGGLEVNLHDQVLSHAQECVGQCIRSPSSISAHLTNGGLLRRRSRLDVNHACALC